MVCFIQSFSEMEEPDSLIVGDDLDFQVSDEFDSDQESVTSHVLELHSEQIRDVEDYASSSEEEMPDDPPPLIRLRDIVGNQPTRTLRVELDNISDIDEPAELEEIAAGDRKISNIEEAFDANNYKRFVSPDNVTKIKVKYTNSRGNGCVQTWLNQHPSGLASRVEPVVIENSSDKYLTDYSRNVRTVSDSWRLFFSEEMLLEVVTMTNKVLFV